MMKVAQKDGDFSHGQAETIDRNMDLFGEDSEFSGCPIYTGRFNVLEFDGKEFVYIGDD